LSLTSVIEADSAPPLQPEARATPPGNPRLPAMSPSEPQSLPPARSGPSAGTAELRLVTPIGTDAAAPMVSSPIILPPSGSTRKAPGSDTPHKSFPLGKIVVALVVVLAAWLYFTQHGKLPSPNDADDPAEASNPESVWRDWVLESRRDGYFLYHRELVDQHTDVLFQKRAEANSQETFRNGKIRVRCIIPPPTLPAQYVQFYVRMAPDAKGTIRRYEAYLTHDTVVFALNDSAQGVHEITHWPVPPTPDASLDIVMEIEAKKNVFTVSLNRRPIGTVKDDTISAAGTFGVDGPTETRLNTLSFINLDPPAPPAVSPAPK